MLYCQLAAHALAHVIDGLAIYDAVRAGEIDIFEQTRTGGLLTEGFEGGQAGFVDLDHFAMLNIAHEGGADHIKRTGLRGKNIGLAQLADNQRPDAERITSADHHIARQGHQGETAFDMTQSVHEAIDDLDRTRTGNQMQNDLRIGGRLEDGPFADQFGAQVHEIGEVAIMGEGDAAVIQIGEHRLTLRMNAPPAVE